MPQCCLGLSYLKLKYARVSHSQCGPQLQTTAEILFWSPFCCLRHHGLDRHIEALHCLIRILRATSSLGRVGAKANYISETTGHLFCHGHKRDKSSTALHAVHLYEIPCGFSAQDCMLEDLPTVICQMQKLLQQSGERRLSLRHRPEIKI